MALSPVDAALAGVDTDDPAALEVALSSLAASDLPGDEAIVLLRLRSMAAEKLGRTDEALALLDAAAERTEGEDPELALQEAMVLWSSGRLGDASTAFVVAARNGADDPERAFAALRFLYLLGRPGDGLGALESLFRPLRDLGRAGEAWLRSRGLPSFARLMAHHALFCRMSGRPDRVETMAEWANVSLEGAGVGETCALAVAFARGDAASYGEWLQTWALEPGSDDAPESIRRLAWALHRARESDPVGRALRHLDAVRVEPGDPGWLDDLRTFARAETFHRYGMERDEAPWREKLLGAQPLLFEPLHVMRFGLFEYQERLRPLVGAAGEDRPPFSPPPA